VKIARQLASAVELKNNQAYHARPVRLDTVMMLTGRSRATLWRMEREGRFPRRQKIGARAVAWHESQVRAWIAKRPG
jgi:prophage regulatory protein